MTDPYRQAIDRKVQELRDAKVDLTKTSAKCRRIDQQLRLLHSVKRCAVEDFGAEVD